MRNNFDTRVWTWTEFGQGKSFVYLYYFSSQKEQAQKNGHPIWECKIGETGYLNIDDTEYPNIPLIFKTDNSKTLEKQIHRILKTFDRWVKIPKQSEWLITNPNEVIQIYLFIQDFKLTAIRQREQKT